MQEGYRYTIDQIDDFEWQIFDAQKKHTPTTYYVIVVPVVGVYGYQVILTSYNAIHAAGSEYKIYGPELWSTKFYAVDVEHYDEMMFNIFRCIQFTDVNNPVELSHTFGGYIRNEAIRVPVRNTPSN